uniref:SCP domain-containing protein n=1 Tax=Steinernema glaseri TaxID=37863 RepID=A0A1I7YRC8_9BILA
MFQELLTYGPIRKRFESGKRSDLSLPGVFCKLTCSPLWIRPGPGSRPFTVAHFDRSWTVLSRDGIVGIPRLLVARMREAVRNTHNFYRSKLASGQLFKPKKDNGSPQYFSNIFKLKYSCKMEELARAHAQACSVEKDRNSKIGLMALLTSRNATVESFEQLVKTWYVEGAKEAATSEFVESNYTVEQSVYDDASTEARIRAQFYQVAFSDLVAVGCAVNTCDQRTIFVCRYDGGKYKEYDDKGNVKREVIAGLPLLNKPLFKSGVPCIYDHQCSNQIHPNSTCSSFQYLCCDDLRCSTYEDWTAPLYDPSKKAAGEVVFNAALGLIGLFTAM